MDKNKIILLLVLIVMAVAGLFLWQGRQGLEDSGATLFTEESVNPFGESSNPYENIKTNPFE